MPTLLIFIPTFNRVKSLKFSLDRIFNEIKGLEEEVLIHVSDNASTDATSEYLKSLNHPSLTVSRNTSNIGGARNICLVHRYAHLADYSLIIGDDDYFFRGTINELVGVIKNNRDIDIFFVNSIAFDEKHRTEVIECLNTFDSFIPQGGVLKSSLTTNFRCHFKNLINPSIDEVFCGSLMCYVFRSNAVTDFVSISITDDEFGGMLSSYPQTLNKIYSMKPDSLAAHLCRPITFNFWHKGSSWGEGNYDRVVSQGLGFVFFEMVRLGYIKTTEYASLFQHYLSVASPAILKLTIDLRNRAEHKSLDNRYLELLVGALLQDRNGFINRHNI
jgi:glycosyltransferase involved in cell wall biosynthesis